jgi:hypothetical protein
MTCINFFTQSYVDLQAQPHLTSFWCILAVELPLSLMYSPFHTLNLGARFVSGHGGSIEIRDNQARTYRRRTKCLSRYIQINLYADTLSKTWLDLGRYAREVLAA